MTANEMKYDFLLKYDKITNFSSPGYTDREIGRILTSAQDEFIRTRYIPKGNKYNEGFEETEKRSKDLAELTRGPRDNSGSLVTSISSNQNGVVENGTFFNIPTDVLYVISEEAIVDSENCKTNENLLLPVKRITHDYYTINKRNPNRKPYIDGTDGLVWRLDYSTSQDATPERRVELITDGSFDILEYHVRYIKKPLEIVPFIPPTQGGDGTTTAIQNCELDSSTHPEIVNIAVRIATGITNLQEYQVKVSEEKLSE